MIKKIIQENSFERKKKKQSPKLQPSWVTHTHVGIFKKYQPNPK